MEKLCFAPVTDRHTRVLILGSLPGDASLAQNRYYGHPQNQFWRLMSEVTVTDLTSLPYQARLDTLQQNGIGLWDVIAKARRTGSLDSNIKNHTQNDLTGLINALPALSVIAFNGATATRVGRLALGVRANSLHIISLPSSSPAYTLPYSEKLQAWLKIKQFY